MYVVYTRRELKSGRVIKGMRKFRTEKERSNYIITAPFSISITAWGEINEG